MRTKTPSTQQREKTKRALAQARAEAVMSKARGIEWHVMASDEDIDVTVLAFLSKAPAKEWIYSTVRSCVRLHGWDGKDQERARQALWEFWKGS